MKKEGRIVPGYLKPTAASKAKQKPLVKREKKETQKKPVLMKEMKGDISNEENNKSDSGSRSCWMTD